jgi:curved DNA-binding protein
MGSMQGKDYYKLLGTERSATADEIRKTYRKLAMQFHPDRNPGNKAAEDRFKEINEAYAVLSDAEKRKQYDTFGAEGFGQRFSQEDIFKGFDFQSIFRDMGFGGDMFGSAFGGGGGRRGHSKWGDPFSGQHQRAVPKGEDTVSDMRISFYESINGGERVMQVPTPEGGWEKISVKIPAGVSTGKTLRLKGKGGVSPYGGERGNLHLRIVVEDDAVFSRDGNDLRCDVKVPVSVLVLGGSVEVPTMAGPKRVKVAKDTQPCATLRLQGLGAPAGGGNQGDLFARLIPVLPTKPDEKVLRLFRELAEAGF